MEPRKFTFYHADRSLSLKEGMVLTLEPSGLSRFGNAYAPHFDKAQQSDDDALMREWLAEGSRQAHYPQEPSRLVCLFGANTVWEAEQFAKEITPTPQVDIPIFEVFASSFTSHDMNWLDYTTGNDPAKTADNMKRYWWREISNSAPLVGDRKSPRIEVKISLPVTVGKLVSWVRFNDSVCHTPGAA